MKKQQRELPSLGRQCLIHVTPVECADLIIESQTFKTGRGLYGNGVYFANTLEAAALKVKHHRESNIRWTYLIADVYIGKYKEFKKDEAASRNVDTQQLINEGYNSIIGFKQPTGREIVCLDPSRIHNIKYIYGQKPSKFFYIDRPRIVLFYVTNVNNAPEIHRSQQVPETVGPFGKGYYLYYTITDAKRECNENSDNLTFFACDAYLDSFYTLHNRETLGSKHICEKRYKSFHGYKNHIHYYIFKDPRLLDSFHFCGGKPWNLKEH